MRSSLLLLLLALPWAAAAQLRPNRPAGTALTGIPALNFDADDGVGYGALLQYYDYGATGASPYRYSVQPTLFATTRGRRDLVLFLDAPHVLPTGWRASGAIAREQQLAYPYYGAGNATLVDDNATNGANKYFYRYDRRTVRGNADVQRNITTSLRGLAGVGASNVVVNTVPYGEGTTLLASELGRGALPPTNVRYARMGLVFDTRDREIGPRQGTWAELLVQRAGRVLGGDEVFTRTTATVREYTPVGDHVTLAQRLVVQNVSGSVPVQSLAAVQSSFRDDEALGGAGSLRGFPKNRYIGKGVAFMNNELRWDAAEFGLLGRPSRLILSTFIDAGRVWSDALHLDESLSDLHTSYGGGARLAIGPTFVLAADVGHSSQSAAAVYVGLGYLF